MTHGELGKEAKAIRARVACSIWCGLLIAGTAYSQTATPIPPGVLADAVLASDLAAVKKLVEQGADIHGLDTRPNVAGANGRRPLNWAALENDAKMIELLLELGADINRQNLSGFTPLHHAAEVQAVEAIKLLLARGADTAIKNKNGQTPAEYAVATRRHRAAEALGASPEAQ
jgi:ankyrin repeat protein